MATTDDVQKLAALARISVTDAELETFVKEFDGILAYVGQLNTLALEEETVSVPPLRNVMREDGEPHEPGIYTEKIASQFPKRKGNYLSVKQIISHD